MRSVAAVLGLVAALLPGAPLAIPLDALDPGVARKLGSVDIRGNQGVSSADLRQAMSTRARPWYTPWRERPPFDPFVLTTDVERLVRLYRARGYHHATVEADVTPPSDGDVVAVTIRIHEGPPTRTETVDVTIQGSHLPDAVETALLADLPLEPGAVFTEERYQRTEATLRTAWRERGFARVTVTRAARVDTDTNTATATYTVDSGPPSVFGDVTVVGSERVGEAVILRELAFHPDESFRESLLERTRRNLLALNLFRLVRIDEIPGDDPRVDLRIEVRDAPPRDIRLGIGYATDEGIGGLASWRHFDFLGGARQLGFSVRVSQILRSAQADFLQPRFPTLDTRFRLLASASRENEDSFDVERYRGLPRLEWRPDGKLSAYTFYRVESDHLVRASPGVVAALPGSAPSNALLSGPGFGASWIATDDFVNPSRGWEVTGSFEPVGTIFGGDINFVRLIAEGRAYVPLPARLFGSARVRVGTAEPLDGTPEIPLYERFYAGGVNSVRGYGRWRIGPLVNNRPLGGRSLVEASIELRRHIAGPFTGLVFVDAGQVSLESFHFPVGTMRYGTGLGVRFDSPVGPIGADLGFPITPPAGDQRWQVSLSVARTF